MGSIYANDDKTKPRYAGAMCLDSGTSEHQFLQDLYNLHPHDLPSLAAAVIEAKPEYMIDPSKLIARAPATPKQFAWQCVEGYYCTDGPQIAS